MGDNRRLGILSLDNGIYASGATFRRKMAGYIHVVGKGDDAMVEVFKSADQEDVLPAFRAPWKQCVGILYTDTVCNDSECLNLTLPLPM